LTPETKEIDPMSIFGREKNRPHGVSTTMRRTASKPSSRRPHHPPQTSPEAALKRIHVAADEARAEIASLVEEELRRLEETEARIHVDLQEVVRKEVAAELDKRRASRRKSSSRSKKSASTAKKS
jgi:hypothetical protein